jgi:hypothetical protein
MEQGPCEVHSCRTFLLPDSDEALVKCQAGDGHVSAKKTRNKSHRGEPYLSEIDKSKVHFVITSIFFFNAYFF